MRNIGHSYSFMGLDFYKKKKSYIKFYINVVDGKVLNVTTLQLDIICIAHDSYRFCIYLCHWS